MAGIPRLIHRNEWPSHKRSLDGEVYNLHYKVAHHRGCVDNPTMPPHMTLLSSEHLLIFRYIMINSSLFMRIVTHVLLNMAILMLTLVRTYIYQETRLISIYSLHFIPISSFPKRLDYRSMLISQPLYCLYIIVNELNQISDYSLFTSC